jgi:hypothetical protein
MDQYFWPNNQWREAGCTDPCDPPKTCCMSTGGGAKCLACPGSPPPDGGSGGGGSGGGGTGGGGSVWPGIHWPDLPQIELPGTEE